jgi:glutaredoxin
MQQIEALAREPRIPGPIYGLFVAHIPFALHGFLARGYNQRMHEVVVYSRKGCHLCDVVKETLTHLQGDADFQWCEVDIDADPQLCAKYNDEIPIVFIDGRKAFKYHMDGQQFLRVLGGRAQSERPA